MGISALVELYMGHCEGRACGVFKSDFPKKVSIELLGWVDNKEEKRQNVLSLFWEKSQFKIYFIFQGLWPELC